MNRDQILELLPHRDPFVMVDEVVEIDAERIVALKHVRDDEDWCRGHFPGNPIMPGVLVAEAMAQAAGVVYTDRIGDKGRSTAALNLAKLLLARGRLREARTGLEALRDEFERTGRGPHLLAATSALMVVDAREADWEGWQAHRQVAMALLEDTHMSYAEFGSLLVESGELAKKAGQRGASQVIAAGERLGG